MPTMRFLSSMTGIRLIFLGILLCLGYRSVESLRGGVALPVARWSAAPFASTIDVGQGHGPFTGIPMGKQCYTERVRRASAVIGSTGVRRKL